MISRTDVDHVARLARLDLGDAEAAEMARELSKVLGYVEEIQRLDLENVAPTAHVVDLVNALRADRAQPSLQREQALRSAPEPLDGGFGVPSPGASAD